MTKEELLKTYLEDDIFVEKGYLDEDEVESYEWTDGKGEPIIEVLKTIIKENRKNKGVRTIVRLSNQVLDNRL